MSKGQPGQPSARSSLIQTLLIAAVIFLGLQLLFPKPNTTESKRPDDLAAAWQQAKKENNVAEIIAVGPEYEKTLIKGADGATPERIIESWRVRMDVALARLQKGKANGDYNGAVLAHSDLRSLEVEILQDRRVPASERQAWLQQVRQAIETVASEGDQLARTQSNGFIKLGYTIVDGLTRLLGGKQAPGFSYWFSAVVLAFLVRLLIWPLYKKQYVAFKRMALLQPMIKELQEEYQGPELQQRIMKLYAKYGINPLSGCWPMLIQIPFFLWVFWSMRAYQFQYMKGTFFWINPELAAKYPSLIAPNLGERDVPLIILYALSMVLSTQFTISSPENARQQKIIGFIMAALFPVMFIFWPLPSAFVVYWIALNIFSTLQTIAMNRTPIPPLEEVPEHLQKPSLFVPKDGPTGTNGKEIRKTGAPVLHKKQNGKQKRKKRK
jgi:YidC/Oxa1 family membrane protein insertase